MKKVYVVDQSGAYNHGCDNYAEYESNDGLIATCTYAQSCHNCWQVGHDEDFIFAEVGDIVLVKNLLCYGSQLRIIKHMPSRARRTISPLVNA